MPELPEVEALRRDLAKTLPGRRITGAAIAKPNMIVPTGRTLEELVGRAVLQLRRRAKLLIFELSDDLAMAVHLKLAGQLVHRRGDVTLAAGGHPVPAFDAPLPHRSTHGRFDLDDGSTLWLTDIRQFGRVAVLAAEEVASFIAEKRLGLEPFDEAFTPEYLAHQLSRHKRLPLKSALLDQSRLVGLGNIYADEVLCWSGIHPERPAGGLTSTEIDRLYAAIRDVLTHAIENGVADIPNGRARPGAIFPRAHGRAGLPCLTCGSRLERIKVGARSTDFCPVCQPLPAPATRREAS